MMRAPRLGMGLVTGLLTGLTLSLLFGAGAARADDVMEDHARRGGAYQRMVMEGLTPQACAALCHGDAMCRSWVWTRAELTGTDAGCALLSAAPTPYRAPGQVTGLGRSLRERIEAASQRPPSERELPALRATLQGPF
ncbi:PAN domain-containing protein [Maricaulis sp.]|uniref:PAN domain-containing protein n=1 Tax=Maricaulis sp. TaxID=1486257 RepID=UPI0025B8A6A9|nr:PAN domain-containing protein [Maricaulis sp.]